MAKALNGQNSPKQNILSPNFQGYLKNPASLNACFPLSLSLVLFQTLQNFTWPNSSCDLLAFELIKYIAFQMSGNKPDKTPYLMLQTIILKSKLQVTN